MSQVITQFEVSFEDVRNEWVPSDANIIYEDRPTDGHVVVVYAHLGQLNVMRFFVIGNRWVSSHDYCEYVIDIEGMEYV